MKLLHSSALLLSPPRWPFAVQIAAAILALLLLLPWAVRGYGAWWDLAFRPGSFVERMLPRPEAER